MSIMGHVGGSTTKWFDLCRGCAETLVGKFLEGEETEAITKPPVDPAETDVSVLTHEPTLDCQWMINPGTGRMICHHDDAELYDALVTDLKSRMGDELPERCDECGKSVPRYHLVLHTRENHPPESDPGLIKRPWETEAGAPLTRVSAEIRATNERNEETIRTTKCPPACTEQHTYRGDCLLSVIYQPSTSIPRQTRKSDGGK